MIKLIKNEFKKIGIFKLSIPFIIFLIVIIFIYEFTDDMKNTIYKLIPFIGIVVSIFYSGIVSNEIENGTFRFYLTKPVSRINIYKSKFIAVITYQIILLLYILFIYYVLCKDIDRTYIIKYVKYCSPLLVNSGIIILLSVLFRNTSITVGISIFIMVFGILITQLLLDIKFTMIEFTFLPYMDFTLFEDIETIKLLNQNYKINLSIKKGLIINIISTIIFYKIGEYLFNKKDIKN